MNKARITIDARRPKRMDLAWMSTEINAFGTSEFIEWRKLTEVKPMLDVNLGTRGPDEAREYLEYCNHHETSETPEVSLHLRGFPALSDFQAVTQLRPVSWHVLSFSY